MTDRVPEPARRHNERIEISPAPPRAQPPSSTTQAPRMRQRPWDRSHTQPPRSFSCDPCPHG
eukprot:9109157-Pyramimonas_sp.AAC.1